MKHTFSVINYQQINNNYILIFKCTVNVRINSVKAYVIKYLDNDL